jgi:L-2-hydroxyglutarate oxidase LhgO
MENAFDIVIIGGGIVGLAIAARLAKPERDVCLLERHDAFGRETSSRNSEVLHSGLYYQPGSLKARLCLEGQDAVYRICAEYPVPMRRVGKLVVACEEDEIPGIEKIHRNAVASGVEGLEIVDQAHIRRVEPHVRAVAAIWCPKTGIVDSHQLMRHFEQRATDGGAILSYHSNVVGLERVPTGWRVVFEESGARNELTTRLLINSAGLGAERIAQMAGINTVAAGYVLKPCKGEYFAVSGTGGKSATRLIYPLPPTDMRSIGLHATPDMQGRLRLGPSAEYIPMEEINYDVHPAHRDMFYEEGRRYLPFITREGLTPDMAGVRPKLKGPTDPFRDFEIHHEADKGCPGLVNLIGIESPGLTASPAIAGYVEEIVGQIG